jgi:hypothetical protein
MDETAQTGRDLAPVAPAVISQLALPSFESCMVAVSVDSKSGMEALSSLSAALQQSCPELKTILQSSVVRTSLETHARQNAEAIRQQASLMREATRANQCLMAAGVASGLVLAVAAELSDDPFGIHSGRSYLTLGLGILTLALGAAGSFFGYLAHDQGRIVRWQTRRGEAEIERLQVFKTIADQASKVGPAVALHGLALMVTHLLNDQRSWLVQRAHRHRMSSETTSRWGGLANALLFIGGSGAIIASVAEHSIWIVLAGLIGAAISTYAVNRDALLGDRTNADRYEKAQVALDGLAGQTDNVATQIVKGEPKALVVFTDAVTDLLATEHKQWLEGTAQAEASLSKLDAQLKQLTEAKS